MPPASCGVPALSTNTADIGSCRSSVNPSASQSPSNRASSSESVRVVNSRGLCDTSRKGAFVAQPRELAEKPGVALQVVAQPEAHLHERLHRRPRPERQRFRTDLRRREPVLFVDGQAPHGVGSRTSRRAPFSCASRSSTSTDGRISTSRQSTGAWLASAAGASARVMRATCRRTSIWGNLRDGLDQSRPDGLPGVGLAGLERAGESPRR